MSVGVGWWLHHGTGVVDVSGGIHGWWGHVVDTGGDGTVQSWGGGGGCVIDIWACVIDTGGGQGT